LARSFLVQEILFVRLGRGNRRHPGRKAGRISYKPVGFAHIHQISRRETTREEAHMELRTLIDKYCSDFKVSYERKTADSVSVTGLRTIIANLARLEDLLNKITDKATLEEFLLCADPADLWPLKKRIIDAVPEDMVLERSDKEGLLKQIKHSREMASKRLGALCLDEFGKKANTETVRKNALLLNVQKKLREWLRRKGNEDELKDILFVGVCWDPFRDLLKGIKDSGRHKDLIVLVYDLFVSPIATVSDPKGVLSVESHSPLVLMSEISKAIEGSLSDGVHTVSLFVPGTIVMDADMKNEKYSGKNIVIVCEDIEMSSGDRIIDVSGRPGQSAPAEHAKSGTTYVEIVEGGKTLKVGEDGKDGENGKDASISGDIIVSCSKVSGPGKLAIKANGANGGNGQNGGDGKSGFEGDAGKDADNTFSPVFLFGTDGKCYLYEGSAGNTGGRGGKAGNGGSSGLGSKEGGIHLFGGAGTAIETSQKSGVHGQVGKAGNPGQGGKGGKGGHHGLKLQWTEHRYVPSVREVISVEETRDYFVSGKQGLEDFDAVWTGVQANMGRIAVGVKEKVQDKFGRTGSSGAPGAMGNNGKIGGKVGDKIELLVNPNQLNPNKTVADRVVRLFEDQSNREFVLHNSGIFDAGTLEPAFLFALFKEMEEEERKTLNSAQEVNSIRLAKSIYEKAQKSILHEDAILGPDWQGILFNTGQKLSYFDERLAGGGTKGNQVVNLGLLADQISALLAESEKTTVAEKKEHYYNEFNNRINSNIASGVQQVSILKDRIDTLMNKSSQDISHILDEISTMKEKEEKYTDELIKKREALQSEMEKQLIFGVLSSVVSVVGTIAGAGSVFSGISQSISGVLSDRESTKLSIGELQDKIQSDQKIIQANKDFITERFRPVPDMPLDIPLEMRKEVLSRLELKDLRQFREESEKEMKPYWDKIKDLESQRLRWDSYLQSKADLSLDDFNLAEKGKKDADDQVQALIKENEDLPQVLYDFRRAEIEALKNEQEIKIDKAKCEKLEKHAKELDEQEESYRHQRITKSIGVAVGVASNIYSGVTKFLDTKKEYEGKIGEVNQALESSKEKIAALVNMDNNVRAYQEETLNRTLKTYLGDEQNAFTNQDTFKLTVSQLDVKNKLTSMMNEAKKHFGALGSSSELIDTLQSIEEVLATQITIFDKIQGQEAQRQMGELIYGLTSAGPQWSSEQLDYLKSSKVLRLQYMTQLELNAFLLWSFPFGYKGIVDARKMGICSSDSFEDAVKKARSQNEAIADWLEKDQYSLLERDVPTLYRNFVGDSTYATIDFKDRMDEAKRLLTGEKITLLLPPSKEFDVVKYITFYAYMPLYKEGKADRYRPDEIMVDLEFRGATSFSVYDEKRNAVSIYQFNQDPISITHSLDVKIEDKQGCEAIWASEEDKVIRKFKNNNIDSGRSPYSQVSMQISKNEWNKSFSSWSEVSKKLKDRFVTVFPSGTHGINNKIESILSDIRDVGWISDKNKIIAPWSEISSAEHLESRGYTTGQAKWIKDVLFERSNVFGLSELTGFEVQFVGYGIFLHRGRFQVPEEYERFKVALGGSAFRSE
jgi:hypothetical protein